MGTNGKNSIDHREALSKALTNAKALHNKTQEATPTVIKLNALDMLSLLLDEVYKVRTVLDETMFWFDAMPAASERAERLTHCAYGADRAGIMTHVAEDKLDDLEAMINRFAGELTEGFKSCTMGGDDEASTLQPGEITEP